MKSRSLLLILSLALILVGAQAQTITTFAGNGTVGYAGDGGPATSAELNGGAGIALDKSGDLFIADTDEGAGTSNCLVREVNTGGTIFTAAGLVTGGTAGNCGYTGDDLPATSAELNFPEGVVFDSSGNYYIADNSNCRIRKVSSSGTITTFAGTGICGYNGDGIAATSAEVNNPNDVKLDITGNLFIADHCLVREVNTSGVISTVAGMPGNCGYSGDGGPATSAALQQLGGITLDSSGNLYITDYADCVVRQVNSSGVINTVAGVGGACGYNGDGIPATSADLNLPVGLAVDGGGNLYISDYSNCLVREVSRGTISTVAGVVAGGMAGNCGYTGDSGPATSADLSGPAGLAFDSKGDLFIADEGNSVIREVAGLACPTATSTTLTSNANPSVGGQAVTFTATVSPAPTSSNGLGSVTWRANGTVIGSHGLLTNYDGVVGLSYSGLAPSAAAYSIVATYNPPSGGQLCASSSSPALMQIVNSNSTTATLNTSTSSTTYGQSVMLSATVMAGGGVTPTGTVSFKNGSTTLGNATLSGGSAHITTSALPAGTDSVTAVYEGSNLLPGSTSAAQTVNVTQATSTVGLATTSSAIVYGQTATITATVTPADGGHAGGTVTFTKNGAAFSTVNVSSSNTASISANSLGIGTFTVGATFNGDSNVSSSTASTISQTVNKDTSTTVTTSSASGTTVTITSTVSTTAPGTAAPTGVVVFYNAGSSMTCGGTRLGNANLSSGAATLKVTLAAGTYNLCSIYEGSEYENGSTSATEAQTVN